MEVRMKKLRLELDALAVESFSTDAAGNRKGTVQGNLVDTTGDDYSYGAGCTQYCETNGGIPKGNTCDIRCYPTSKCNWATQGEITCDYNCAPTVALTCDDLTCVAQACWSAQELPCQ
jgi:hypothetical protein